MDCLGESWGKGKNVHRLVPGTRLINAGLQEPDAHVDWHVPVGHFTDYAVAVGPAMQTDNLRATLLKNDSGLVPLA